PPPSGGGACAHDPCTAGDKLDPGCDKGAAAVCATDSYCCATKWDAVCVNEAKSAGVACAGGAEPTPTPSACAHDVCAARRALDPACDACAKQVIVADGYCGSTSWDATCVKEAASICGAPCQ